MRKNFIAITFNISTEKWPLCRVCQCGLLNEGETIFLPDNESGAQFCGKFNKTFFSIIYAAIGVLPQPGKS